MFARGHSGTESLRLSAPVGKPYPHVLDLDSVDVALGTEYLVLRDRAEDPRYSDLRANDLRAFGYACHGFRRVRIVAVLPAVCGIKMFAGVDCDTGSEFTISVLLLVFSKVVYASFRDNIEGVPYTGYDVVTGMGREAKVKVVSWLLARTPLRDPSTLRAWILDDHMGQS